MKIRNENNLSSNHQSIVLANAKLGSCSQIYIDHEGKDFDGLSLVTNSFGEDIRLICGCKPEVVTDVSMLTGTVIIAGTIGQNKMIDGWIESGQIDVEDIRGKREVYKIIVMEQVNEMISNAIIVVGTEKRGTIYGIYHISELMGVSPWVYWGDVTVKTQEVISFTNEELQWVSKEPSIKYRGFFLNDEQPSLEYWAKLKFGGSLNEKFYAHVFELLLRLKGNYMWPAMWGNMFCVDGSEPDKQANLKLAHAYGVVIGTSHHEAMCRAGSEWQHVYKDYSNSNAWDYTTNEEGIKKFWEDGILRNRPYEAMITLGMRGEEDSALAGGMKENIENLRKIIITQKEILKKYQLEKNPTVLVIYKEVEQYWYGSKEVEGLNCWSELDGTTIMLSDDNFGNMRTLPRESARNRTGGWGVYYHFDYHGGPRSYEWVNSIQLEKVWEQMTMAYDYGVRDIWIVNVGDLKPMELPLSYFMDMAYDFEKYGTSQIDSAKDYLGAWVKQQFENDIDSQGLLKIEEILKEYTKINGARKPENITKDTYSFQNYQEASRMLSRIENLINLSEEVKKKMDEKAMASYFQLVYYPAVASANVNAMEIFAGLHDLHGGQGRSSANMYAKMVEKAIAFDKELQDIYNNRMPLVGDKWKNMMSSPHVGYINWNAEGWSYPTVNYMEFPEKPTLLVGISGSLQAFTDGEVATLPAFTNLKPESGVIELANGGKSEYSYELFPSDSWIVLEKTEGTVVMEDQVKVSVDFSLLTQSKKGSITISSDCGKIQVEVHAKLVDVEGLEDMTFVGEHGYFSIEAAHFAKAKEGGNGAKWLEIENLGKTLSGMKVYPTTTSFTQMEEAPYLEYQVRVEEEGEYELQVFLAPTNPLCWDYVSMKYGVCIDENEPQVVEAFKPTFVPGMDPDWNQYVMDNIHITQSQWHLKKGIRMIRIYSLDAGVVLEKLILYPKKKGLEPSYFGPEESYYVK